jgi:hypothetical protein
MCIVAQDGSTFARLRFNVGPGGEVKIPVFVDYGCEFEATNFEHWKQLYKANVTEEQIFKSVEQPKQSPDKPKQETEIFGDQELASEPQFLSEDLLSEIDSMEPFEREMFMEELAIRSEFWNEESEVFYG